MQDQRPKKLMLFAKAKMNYLKIFGNKTVKLLYLKKNLGYWLYANIMIYFYKDLILFPIKIYR